MSNWHPGSSIGRGQGGLTKISSVKIEDHVRRVCDRYRAGIYGPETIWLGFRLT
jgi:hypothetical protein